MWLAKLKRAAVVSGAVAAIWSLTACGFQPLYGGVTGEIRSLELSQISVSPITVSPGNDLRNSLIDRLTPNGEPVYPQYRLDIALSESREGVAIQEDASVTRYNYQLTARYELFDLGLGETIHRGSARSIAAYNVAESEFATLSAERDAAQRVAEDLGNQIELRLALFFEQRRR